MALLGRSNPAATTTSFAPSSILSVPGRRGPARWHHLPFSGLIGTETAVEWTPVDVLGVELVRIWEVVEGSDAAVLLSISVFIEVVIVPGIQGEETGSYSPRAAESKTAIDFRS